MATPAPSTNAAREARRRRILERGSDRLALISGRIQSLPPDQSPPPTSSPAQVPAAAASHSIHSGDSSQYEDALSNPSQLIEETSKEPRQQTISDEAGIPPPRNYQNGRNILEPSRSAPSDNNGESSQIPSSSQRPAQDHQFQQTHRSLFTPSQIKSAIGASENTRTSCSIAAAVLVVAAYMGFPIVSFMLFRPVYLLLLTNTTVVLVRVFLRARGVESSRGRRSRASTAGGHNLAGNLGRALELGLLVQKIIGAAFMDFSVYAVVLVSGLSLVRNLGW